LFHLRRFTSAGVCAFGRAAQLETPLSAAVDMPVPRRPALLPDGFFGRQAVAGYLFLLPSAVVLGVFVFWPIVQSVILSLHQWKFGSASQRFVGLANYLRLIHDARAWNAFGNTLYYTAVTVPLGIVLPLALALALNQRIPGRVVFRAAFFLPVIGSFAIIAIVWSFLIDPDIGLLTYWLTRLGLPKVSFLRDPNWAMPAIILVSVWKNIGFNMVIYLAGLQAIPRDLYEAAEIDGAGKVARFRYVTWPQLRTTNVFVLIISVIGAFQVFDPVYVMTPTGGPLFSTETVVSYIYRQGIQLLNISYAASIGVVLFLIVFALTLLQLRITARRA
jgi:multiple sugar transport system permease protein